jgi:hypothetical protein
VFEEFGVLRFEFGFWGFWSSEFVFVLFCLNLFTNFCFLFRVHCDVSISGFNTLRKEYPRRNREIGRSPAKLLAG